MSFGEYVLARATLGRVAVIACAVVRTCDVLFALALWLVDGESGGASMHGPCGGAFARDRAERYRGLRSALWAGLAHERA